MVEVTKEDGHDDADKDRELEKRRREEEEHKNKGRKDNKKHLEPTLTWIADEKDKDR